MITILLNSIVVLGGMGLLLGALLGWLNRKYRSREHTIVDEIEALLPLTQCAQCGYAGCRPYAEAIATGGAFNQCPPGGEQTIANLAKLLGRPAQALNETYGSFKAASIALIDEQQCIGCTLCIPVCPVDAIVGANQLMHTVLEEHCTGCELCIEPCPVDCITLIEVQPIFQISAT
jgi:electron transport complex protein RnfB